MTMTNLWPAETVGPERFTAAQESCAKCAKRLARRGILIEDRADIVPHTGMPRVLAYTADCIDGQHHRLPESTTLIDNDNVFPVGGGRPWCEGDDVNP